MTSFLLSITFIFIIVIFILILGLKSFVKNEMHKLNIQLSDLKMQLAKQRFENKELFSDEKVILSEIKPDKHFEKPEVKKEEKVTEKIEEKIIKKNNDLGISKIEKKITTDIPEKKKPIVKPLIKKKKTDFEKFIGENLMNKVGILILVVAVGLGIKYAIGEGWVNEAGRIGVGLLTGVILIGIAHKLRINYTAFSSVLIGGGIAVFYSTIAFGFQLYELFTQTQAFIIMVAITGFAIALSLSYNKKELAVLAILGGFASPIMVSTGAGNYIILFTYIMILNVGMLVLAYFKKWNLVNIVSYVSTVLLFSIWMIGIYEDKGTLPWQGALIFASGFYLIFFLMNIINNLKEEAKFSTSDFVILISNTFFYYAVGMYLIGEFSEASRGIFTLALAILNFIFAFTLYKREQIDRNLVFLLIGLVLTFVSLAAPVQLDGNFITMFWALESVLLLWLSQKSGIRIMKISSFLVMLLMIISLIIDWEQIYINPDIKAQTLAIIFNKGFITSIVSIIALVLNMNLLKKDNDIQFMKKLPANVFSTIVTIFVIVSLYIAIILELGYQVDQYYDSYKLTTVALAFFSYIYILGILLWAGIKQIKIVFEGITYIAILSLFIYVFGVGIEYKRVVNSFLFDDLGYNFSLLHFLTALSALFLAFFSWNNIKAIFKTNITIINIILWVNVILSVVIISMELDYIVLLLNQPSLEQFYNLQISVHRIGWPIMWGVFAFVLMIVGMKKNMKNLRIISITLFFFTLLKLFAVDVWDMSEGGRIAAFISLGIILLVISFLYQKLRKLIFEEEEENGKLEINE